LFQRDPSDLGWSDYNRVVNDTEGFERLCFLAAKHDLRVHTVVSDRLKDAIPVFEKVAAQFPLSGRRWVAEHISSASPSLLEALRRLDIGVTLIPLGHVWKLGQNFKDTPESPLDLVVPAKALVEMGVPVAAATDGAPFDPLVTLWSLVTRTVKQTGQVAGAGGCMRNEDALRLLTVAGAWLTFDEHLKGPLRPGYLADLTVFERDPLATEGDEILDNTCLATMVGGNWVYRRQ
jgi:predicted amidohydrolase YtcJ